MTDLIGLIVLACLLYYFIYGRNKPTDFDDGQSTW